MAFSIPELQALVIATQPRELQLVNLNNLLDLLDARLDVQHDMFVKSITSLMVLFLKSSIAFCNALMTSSSSGDFPLSFLTSETFYVTESFFQPAVPPFCYANYSVTTFTNTDVQHELFHLDNSHRILRGILLRCSNNQTTTSPAVGTALSFMGPEVPSLAVFFTSIWHVFHQTFCHPPAGWPARVSSSLLVNLRLPCPRRRLRLGLCFVLQARAAECLSCIAASSSELTPTAVFHELLFVTVLTTPRATSHPPWHRRHGFVASLPASPQASLHASHRPQRLHVTRLFSAG